MSLRMIDERRGIGVIDGLLSAHECQHWIQQTETIGYQAAPLTTRRGPLMAPEVRNNRRVMIDRQTLASGLWNRLCLLGHAQHLPVSSTDTLVGLNERFRFYRYERGERFNWHLDGAYVRSRTECSRLTLMVYLSEGFEGGETRFAKTFFSTHRYLAVRPRAGMALFFPHRLLHTGAEVIEGMKYVMRTDIMASQRAG